MTSLIGTIFAQDPAAGSDVLPGATVTISVYGPPEEETPCSPQER